MCVLANGALLPVIATSTHALCLTAIVLIAKASNVPEKGGAVSCKYHRQGSRDGAFGARLHESFEVISYRCTVFTEHLPLSMSV